MRPRWASRSTSSVKSRRSIVSRAVSERAVTGLPPATTGRAPALAAGADALKIFPAGMMGTEGLRAIRAVLPRGTLVYAVGGVGPRDFADWCAAGADGFGLGSSLFQPEWTVERVSEAARASAAARSSSTAS